MPKLIPEETKKECLRLREEERMSLKGISLRTGVAKSTLSLMLRDLPLKEEEKRRRYQKAARGTHKKSKDPFTGYTKTDIRTAAQEVPSKYFRMCDYDNVSPGEKGDISEYAAGFRLVLHGWLVYKSIFSGSVVDWIVRDRDLSNQKLAKVQVKTASRGKWGNPTVTLRQSDGRNKSKGYEPEEVDFFVGYDLMTDQCFVWSYKEVGNRTTSTCSLDALERWDKIKEFLASDS